MPLAAGLCFRMSAYHSIFAPDGWLSGKAELSLNHVEICLPCRNRCSQICCFKLGTAVRHRFRHNLFLQPGVHVLMLMCRPLLPACCLYVVYLVSRLIRSAMGIKGSRHTAAGLRFSQITGRVVEQEPKLPLVEMSEDGMVWVIREVGAGARPLSHCDAILAALALGLQMVYPAATFRIQMTG